MRRWIGLGLALACLAGAARGADYKTLRNLNAPPPTQVTPLLGAQKPRPLQFVKIVIQPRNGENWAIAYTSIAVRAEGDNTPAYKMMTWSSGRVQEQAAPYKRVFDEELQKAGFAADGGDALFGEGDSAADLKVGVLVNDIQGRFCVDCPNLFNRNGIPASVVMSADWEVYSTLERKVIAKFTTSGGADYKTRLGGSFLPAVYEGFRENVRQLLANEDFRKLVTAPAATRVASGPAAATPASTITLTRGPTHLGRSQATNAVAIVFAADGSGSGFLVSADGYLVTNQHVVGGSKYVKLKWIDGSEALGEVIRGDRRRDVALIKTDAHGRAPLDLRLDPVQQGEPVYAIGTPLDEALQNTMTRGIVSATRVEDGLPYIQSDVAVTHGNSGGPLIDEKGQVVGLTVSGAAPNGSPIGLNFFIPIDDALRALALTPAPGAAAPAVSETVAAQPTRAHAGRKP
jgi:serine protease Do